MSFTPENADKALELTEGLIKLLIQKIDLLEQMKRHALVAKYGSLQKYEEAAKREAKAKRVARVQKHREELQKFREGYR